MVEQVITVVAAVVVTAAELPFASVLFVSLIPVMLSVDYFEKRAIWASVRMALADGKFAGLISSAIECKPVIRVCDAASWILTRFTDLLKDVDIAHRNSFLKS